GPHRTPRQVSAAERINDDRITSTPDSRGSQRELAVGRDPKTVCDGAVVSRFRTDHGMKFPRSWVSNIFQHGRIRGVECCMLNRQSSKHTGGPIGVRRFAGALALLMLLVSFRASAFQSDLTIVDSERRHREL